MLIDNQKATVKWDKRTKDWYIDKGYIFTKTGDNFIVDVQDLSKGSKQKIKVLCDYCNKIITVEWSDYYRYSLNNTKYACKCCRQRKTSDNNLEKRRQHLYKQSLKVCNEKNLKLITPIENIKNASDRVIYNCPKHGNNETKIYTLFSGHGCPKCQYDNSKLTPDEVERRIGNYGATLLNKNDYNGTTTKNLKIKCRDCDCVFITSYNSFICSNGGQYCPECSKYESHGEKNIRLFLENNNIDYISQYRFPDCKDIKSLPFDFYLPTKNKIIEYDGKQHYEPTKWQGLTDDKTIIANFEKIKIHDEIKNQYCKDNGIVLLRIPYWNFNNIENILTKFIL